MKKKIMLLLLVLVVIMSSISIFFGCKGMAKKTVATEYDIDADINWEEKSLKATQLIHYFNNTDTALDKLVLSFNAEAYSSADTLPIEKEDLKKAYPKGVSLANNKINIFVDGVETAFSKRNITGNIIEIPLVKPLEKGKITTIKCDYTSKLPYNTLRYGYNDFSMNLGNFYPQMTVYDTDWRRDEYLVNGDPFYNEMANYQVSVTLDERLKILASAGGLEGKDNVESIGKGKKSLHYSVDGIRDFAIVVSEKGNIITKSIQEKQINYMYFSDASPNETLEASVKSLQTFSNLFGEYIYDTFNVCEIDFLYGGMEYSGLIYITKGMDNFSMQRVVSHETAHQWWYNAVGSDQINSAWQDEALTEYSSVLYFQETNQGQLADKTTAYANASFRAFRKFVKELGFEVNGDMTRRLDEFNNSLEYTVMVYDKGLMMYDSLCAILGRDYFINSCKKYYSAYKGKIATTKQLIDIYDINKKADIKTLFASWLDGSVVISD